VVRKKGFGRLSMMRGCEILGRHLLASEVTPGLLAGAEPDTHQFNVTICFKGVIKWKKTQNNIVSTLKLGQACMGE
jgi:hypothetical protein